MATNRAASPTKNASDMRPMRVRSVCAVMAKYAGRMGSVQGDRKLNTPAMKASRVSARMPDCGRLGFAWNGLTDSALSVFSGASNGDASATGAEAAPVVFPASVCKAERGLLHRREFFGAHAAESHVGGRFVRMGELRWPLRANCLRAER